VKKAYETLRLKYCCYINPSKSNIIGIPEDSLVSFLPMEKVGEDGSLDLSESRPIKDVWSGFTYFEDLDTIVAKITPCFENGKGAFCTNLINGIGFGSTEFHVLRPKQFTDPKYLFYSTRMDKFKAVGKAAMQGVAGQQRVPTSYLNEVRVWRPNLATQHAIATFLDRKTAQIDALIEKKQRQIELLQEKRTALISQAVTKGLNPNVKMKDSGVEWLGEIPEHWGVSRIKLESIRISKGTTPSTMGMELSDFGIRFLKAENITLDGISDKPEFFIDQLTNARLSRSQLRCSDILVVIAGATTGKSSVIDKSFLPANLNQAIAYIRLKNVAYSTFLQTWISLPFVQDQIWQAAVQSAQPNLSMEDLGNLVSVIPGNNELPGITRYIKKVLNEIKDIESRIFESIKLLQEHRTALISATVTGKIDVRDYTE